ncbi:MAG: single-stranded-DNA-specific exonuclease RecJ [Candidatus Woesebacteria bacterium]|nr:MAG: single-stranded-DNA-specific exonuclease RecJ [Candidatus Woesebacteria bacterium]
MGTHKWEILDISGQNIIKVLLKNRAIYTKSEEKEFFNPVSPLKLSLKQLKISRKEVAKAIKRLNLAKINKEKIFIYGDYDADGVCSTAILWEVLYKEKHDCLPYIPDRFKEGYGLNSETLKKLKEENPALKLIITVDNGIVAHNALKTAKELNLDVIITDHHQKDKKKLDAFAIIHTTKISGSALAWIFAREILKNSKAVENSLDLVAIGTIADQMPQLKENRSFVKHGLVFLKNTKRKGLQEIFKIGRIDKNKIGTYEVAFMIAPRINAMGRLSHAIDSLRLLCVKDLKKAKELAKLVNKTNEDRQKIVEEMLLHAEKKLAKSTKDKIIILDHKSYHEGVIGLAASQITEKFYRPSIVISTKGDIAKASARSIKGFNIIEAIREVDDLILEGGGHEMAAGFSIEKSKIKKFKTAFKKISQKYLNQDLLTKKLKIDTKMEFEKINSNLLEDLKKFEPTGSGNHTPLFATMGVTVRDVKKVGSDQKHLKFTLTKNGLTFDAIAFNFAEKKGKIKSQSKLDIAYFLEEDNWGYLPKIQLRIRDLKIK